MTHLPSFCPDHPDEPVQVTWDEYPKETEKKYFCSVCGTQLCSAEEFERRCEQAKKLEKSLK
jgi:hypothetical protein